MIQSRINKSRCRLNKKRLSKIKKIKKKYILNGGETIKYANGGVYDGEIKDGKRHGNGKMIYSNNMVYEGEWNNDNKNGRGKLTWPSGSYYDGEWKDDKKNGRGKLYWFNGSYYDGEWKDNKRNGRGILRYSDGNIYEGEWKDSNREGRGTYKYSNGNIYKGDWKNDKENGYGRIIYSSRCGTMEGKYINGLQEGMHTHFSCDRKMVKYYYYNHGKIYTFDTNIDKYIISNQKDNTSDKYITILINLHGSDVVNSKCKLVDNKHVRCISPVSCGQISINDPRSTIDAFLIAYNISHLQSNNMASHYQKMIKTIEVYNEHNPDFFDLDEGIRRPLVDHYYRAIPKDNIFRQIFIIDTNHRIDIFQDSYDLFSQKNTELKTLDDLDIEQYNILSKLRPILNINSINLFLRSNLINVLLDLGYDTINIIDFSCRVFNMENLRFLYSRQQNKNYVCNYTTEVDKNTFIGDVITSI